MKFVYGTDFHGSIPKYESILKFAIEQDIHLIHLGADLLTKGSNMLGIQKNFVNTFLKEFYKRAKENNIDVLAFFGNDDTYIRKRYFKKYATLLDEVPYYKEGYEFKAYGYVPDYKFGLKTACKLDYPGWRCPDQYIGAPIDFTSRGVVYIKDTDKYFLNKGTIEEDLKSIQVTDKTIMAIHSPPYGIGLDLCYDYRAVGSKAVYDWIKLNQPKIVLCGHIHESPAVSNTWKANIGKSIVIQPGQLPDKTTLVVIELGEGVLTNILDIP